MADKGCVSDKTGIGCRTAFFIGGDSNDRKYLHELKARTGEAISFTGWVMKCSGHGWAIPIGIHPLIIALGNIARKPGVVGDAIEIRGYLSTTVLFNHDVIDGAPVSHFIQRLKELIESGHMTSRTTRGYGRGKAKSIIVSVAEKALWLAFCLFLISLIAVLLRDSGSGQGNTLT